MSVLLVLAVAAPVAAAVVATVLPERGVDAVRVAAVVVAVSWFVLLVHASAVSAFHLHSVPIVAAAGCGAGVVMAALDAGTLERPVLAALALAAAALAVAAGRIATDGGGIVLALAAATALSVLAVRPSVRAAVIAAAGLVLAVAGVAALRSGANSWRLPAADAVASHRTDGIFILVGAVLVALAGTRRARTPAAVLVPVGAFLAAQAAPIVHRGDGFSPLAIALAAAAVAAAVAPRRGRFLLDRPAASLLLLGAAVLVAPGSAHGAGLLLLSAAALASAVGWPSAAALGVPGAIALSIALAARGGGAALVVGVLAGGVALALAAPLVRERRPARPSLWVAPALVVGAWLLVAPHSWGWVGPVGLRAYDEGAARALAGAGLCLVGVVLLGRDRAGWYARAFPPDPAGEDAVRH